MVRNASIVGNKCNLVTPFTVAPYTGTPSVSSHFTAPRSSTQRRLSLQELGVQKSRPTALSRTAVEPSLRPLKVLSG